MYNKKKTQIDSNCTAHGPNCCALKVLSWSALKVLSWSSMPELQEPHLSFHSLSAHVQNCNLQGQIESPCASEDASQRNSTGNWKSIYIDRYHCKISFKKNLCATGKWPTASCLASACDAFPKGYLTEIFRLGRAAGNGGVQSLQQNVTSLESDRKYLQSSELTSASWIKRSYRIIHNS